MQVWLLLSSQSRRHEGEAPIETQGATVGRAIEHVERDPVMEPSTVQLLLAASLVSALGAGSIAYRSAEVVTRPARQLAKAFVELPFVHRGLADAYDSWTELAGEFSRSVMDEVRRLLPGVVDAVISELDLTKIVVKHVDINEVAAEVDIAPILKRLDLNEAAARIDLNAIVARVDLNEIVSRIDIDEIAARIDLNAIVERVDVDSIAARIDLEAILDRIDIATIAQDVVEEIDLPEIIRESSGTMAIETIEGVRMQGADADRLVARIVDRLLRRRGDGTRGESARRPVPAQVQDAGDETSQGSVDANTSEPRT